MNPHGDYRGQPERDEHISQAALLGRIDERTKNFASALDAVGESLDRLRDDVVTRAEFDAKFRPVQMSVYGFIALAMTAVVGGIISLVIG